MRKALIEKGYTPAQADAILDVSIATAGVTAVTGATGNGIATTRSLLLPEKLK